MKTAARLTATLIALLALYVFGYWFLIKKDWLLEINIGSTNPLLPSPFNQAVHKVFVPLAELDRYWNVTIPTRKYLTGHWCAQAGNDFVTLSPEGECQFRLGQFTFNGKAEYYSHHLCFKVEFNHENRVHRFILGDESMICTPGPPTLRPPNIDFAHVIILDVVEFDRGARYAYEATLTKQPPSAPAP